MGWVSKVLLSMPKRVFVGRPLREEQMSETLLPKKLALPVFCSDPLSSNAYATEEILLGLSLGGLALLHLAPVVALVVVLLLGIVVLSCRQTCHAYPNGGGAYAVSRANLGVNASLTAAGALLVDYVLTVAVSVAAGVANIVSAVPVLAPHAVGLCLAMITILTLMNLRGVKESGTIFAIPTYGFVAVIFVMIAWGVLRTLFGSTPVAESASYSVAATHGTTGLLAVAIVLRAFSQGCTALTGVEAVSNGVPNFKPPKSDNAATLTIMGALTITMFAGITALALISHVRVAESVDLLIGAPAGYEQKTVITQVAAAVSGNGSPLFFLVAAFTAAILVLAANTAYNGFPILASVLGQDGYLPKQFSCRGDRLVYSNGIVILALLSGLLIWAFDASTTKLIQLYIIGVFVSFTLSQAGMVRHWNRDLATTVERQSRGRIIRARLINTIGAAATGLVLIILITKFTHGAWIVVIAMPVVFIAMKAIRRHYDRVTRELTPPDDGVTLPSRIHAVILVSRLYAPTLRALAFAPGHPPQHPARGHRAHLPRRGRGAARRMGTPRHPGSAHRSGLPLPGHHRPRPRLRRPHPPGQPPRPHLRLRPRIRGRPLVGTHPAQPERPPTQDPPTLRPRRHGHQRPLVPRLRPTRRQGRHRSPSPSGGDNLDRN
jgi:amino acid transporter